MSKASATAVVTMTSLGVLTIGMGKSVVVEKELPPFRFFLACAITSVTLATITMADENVGKGLSLIVIIVVGIDELPPLLQALDGNKDMGVKDYVDIAKSKPIEIRDSPGLNTNNGDLNSLLGPKPKTKIKTTKKGR